MLYGFPTVFDMFNMMQTATAVVRDQVTVNYINSEIAHQKMQHRISESVEQLITTAETFEQDIEKIVTH